MATNHVDSADDGLLAIAFPPFAGYPYIVTRIGHTPLRHISLVPADWPMWRQLEITRALRDANQMDACLVLGTEDALYPDRSGALWSGPAPRGIPITGRLALSEPLPATQEVRQRAAALEAFVEEFRIDGYIIGDGLATGRLATPEDRERLRPNILRINPGLTPCSRCGESSPANSSRSRVRSTAT